MSHSVNKSITAGLAVVLVAVMAVVGVQIVESSNTTNVLTLDTNTEWENGTLTNLTTENDTLLLNTSEVAGTYDSETLSRDDVNEYEVSVDLPDPDNSSVDLVVSGTTYNLEDGYQEVDVSGTHTTFTLEFARDSTSIESPQVSLLRANVVEDSGLLTLIAGASFGLLLLLALLQHVGGLGAGRNPQ